MVKKPKLAYIEWDDAGGDSEWRREDEPMPNLVGSWSVGLIAKKNKQETHIIPHGTEIGDYWGLLVIPTKTITYIEYIDLKGAKHLAAGTCRDRRLLGAVGYSRKNRNTH